MSAFEATPEEFLTEAEGKLSKEGFALVKRSYELSAKAHEGQKRLSGQPYIIHPVNVANIILQDFAPDDKMISAGLLHDVVEDTPYTKEDMIRDFGIEIAELVSGVTKVSKIKKNQNKEIVAAENVRRMLMASIEDPRVMLIKLADKIHNMRTLGFQPPEKQERIAKEVFTVYAPLAGRLGIYKVKSDLEDMAFQILHPEEYRRIKSIVAEKRTDRDDHIREITSVLEEKLKEAGLEARIEGRAKHFYSIHKKLIDKEKKAEEIYDLRAVRIITTEIRDCYGALGVIHTHYTPIPGRFKDYIATPKTNLYQSLHTTVIGNDGRPLEVQIRTEEMNRYAERGIAAHWSYKENSYDRLDDKFSSRWKEGLKRLLEHSDDPGEFIDELKGELHEDEVFAFTPKGDIFEFPKGATVLDFAFRIHTNVGLRTKAAKVNGKITPIRTVLNSGDQVEIVTDKNAKPSPIWEKIVRTPSAKQKLRQYFRKEKDELKGQYTVSKSSNIAISEKDIDTIKEIRAEKKQFKRNTSKDSNIGIIAGGFKDILIRIANCCTPVPGDEIIGFITQGRGVSVHRKNCEFVQNYSEQKKINVRWDGLQKAIPVRVHVSAYDRPKIYMEIVGAISKTDTNILEAGATATGEGTVLAKFLLEIEHLDQLKEILDSIKSIPNIITVERTKT